MQKIKKQIIIAIIILAIILIIKPICPIYAIFHIRCPGCGATRMIISLLHFDFKTAFNYNQYLFILGIPILITTLYQQLNGKKHTKIINGLYWFYLIIAIIFCITRNTFEF